MNFGNLPRGAVRMITTLAAAAALAVAPQALSAQDVTEAAVSAPAVQQADAAPGTVVATDTAPAAPAAGDAAAGYTPLGSEWIKGQPVDKGITFQEQYSKDGKFALWMHDVVLLPIITAICLFVLGLLLWVVVKFNRRSNPVASKTTHNTFIEVVWTLVPVLILVGIAVPSITLLARQYESPPADAVTVKATGYQWYWGYTYPDNGGFEVISNMLTKEQAVANGEPHQLAVDNRLVLPANTPIRLQTTAADVIHSFAIPSLWFKLDAVPGRLNERMLTIEEPGIYYGQCSELCGARHGYMPIAIEALPRPQWEAWVRSQGGTVGPQPTAAAPAPAPAATPAAVPAATEAEAEPIPAPAT
ncbi:cytochrome c oxidase subunit II [Altererythrobacter confluentis]|uniref:Cytochrome c oxidase subunit 2 n=2 Tax=Allopontixanthobacter confluentis TaxID=1849021 RepID=A0A6L7GF85_9SPHN|nr:cytochrome c oxidase subunit II [Allopontixanthobacter confluentis]